MILKRDLFHFLKAEQIKGIKLLIKIITSAKGAINIMKRCKRVQINEQRSNDTTNTEIIGGKLVALIKNDCIELKLTNKSLQKHKIRICRIICMSNC